MIELSQSNPHFRTLPDTISRNEAIWRRWYEENEPEGQPIPDYEQEIALEKSNVGTVQKCYQGFGYKPINGFHCFSDIANCKLSLYEEVPHGPL